MEGKLAMIYQQTPGSQSQALRFDLIQATWIRCSSSDLLYSHLLFDTRGGLSVFLSFISWFPGVSQLLSQPQPSAPTACPVSVPPPARCPMSAALPPCLPGVVGGSLSSWRHVSASTSSQCFSPSLCAIHISFLRLLFFLIFFLLSSSSCPLSIFLGQIGVELPTQILFAWNEMWQYFNSLTRLLWATLCDEVTRLPGLPVCNRVSIQPWFL